jgi:hypothetical protein
MPEPLLAHIARGVLQVQAVQRYNQQMVSIILFRDWPLCKRGRTTSYTGPLSNLIFETVNLQSMSY